MKNTIHTAATAPEKSRPLLEGVHQKMGMIPNILGGMAEAPASLQAYLSLSAAFGSTSLSATEQQVVALSISHTNGCDYCMAAHTTMAQGAGVSQEVLDALRNNTALEPKLEALRTFALRMQDTKGHLEAGELESFLAADFSEEQAFEVITGIALKVITNYSNRLLNTPVDVAFAANTWEKSSCEPACGCNM
ncbi:MAG: carboxymuconolactone decarboxylase family protein [Verrucomicrobiae bacterium]|nr:carboxymuconolactone decarboxylase family protein [Verrucomicrobiae bacterium]NNJ43340.1 carboxymuconolactone decarboxylase family protein [Akkermansiaceae bacterium]